MTILSDADKQARLKKIGAEIGKLVAVEDSRTMRIPQFETVKGFRNSRLENIETLTVNDKAGLNALNQVTTLLDGDTKLVKLGEIKEWLEIAEKADFSAHYIMPNYSQAREDDKFQHAGEILAGVKTKIDDLYRDYNTELQTVAVKPRLSNQLVTLFGAVCLLIGGIVGRMTSPSQPAGAVKAPAAQTEQTTSAAAR